MTKPLKSSRFFPTKNKIKIKPELNLKTFKQKILSRNCFIEYS